MTTWRDRIEAGIGMSGFDELKEAVSEFTQDEQAEFVKEVVGWEAFYIDSDGVTESLPEDTSGLRDGYRPAGGFDG